MRSKEGERLNGEDVWGANIPDASFIPQKLGFQLPTPSTVSLAQVQQLHLQF